MYQPPEAPLLDTQRDSPRARFWLSCLCWVLASGAGTALQLLLSPPLWIWPPLLILGFLVPLVWTLRAHAPVPGGWPSIPRSLFVAFGMALSFGLFAYLGAVLGAIASFWLGWRVTQ